MSPAVLRPYHIYLFYLSIALLWASMYVYVPILPVHAENLGASMGLVGTIVGAYGFSQLVLRIPFGVWSDRIGLRKPFIFVGMVAAAVAGLGLGLTSDPNWLVVWRAVSGIGAASLVSLTVLFASYYPPDKATRAIAKLVLAMGISQTASTYIGGRIAEEWGWNAPFFVAVVLALLGLMATLPLYEKPLVVHREMTIGDLFRIGRNPLLLAVSFITLLSLWATTATSGGFTLVYAARLGASRTDLGMLTTLMQLALMLTTMLCNPVASRIGYCRTVTLGMAIQIVSALMIPSVNTLPMVAFSQVLSGAGRGLSYSLLMGLTIRAVPARDHATAMGVFQAIYAVGMFAGPATTGILGDALGFFSVFYIAGVAAILGLMLTVAKVPSK